MKNTNHIKFITDLVEIFVDEINKLDNSCAQCLTHRIELVSNIIQEALHTPGRPGTVIADYMMCGYILESYAIEDPTLDKEQNTLLVLISMTLGALMGVDSAEQAQQSRLKEMIACN